MSGAEQFVTQDQLNNQLFFNPVEYQKRIDLAVTYIKERLPKDFTPLVAITLGSGGLGDIADDIETVCEPIKYEDIPDFLTTTVEGHKGELVAGKLNGIPVIGFRGRKHSYEDGPQPNPVINIKNVVLPVYVARKLGAEVYFATNAAGGLNPTYNPGDIMVIRSHNGMFMQNPLQGDQVDKGKEMYFQPQFMEYNPLFNMFLKAAAKNINEDDHVHEGVYTALPGRTFETAAESQVLRALGSDAVGMSTVPEVITAANLEMETVGFSLITNVIDADGTNKTSHPEVMAALEAPATRERVHNIMKEFFRLLNGSSILDQMREAKLRKAHSS